MRIITIFTAFAMVLLQQHQLGAQEVNLGTAGQFSVLAGSGITNTGSTTITGDMGTFPTTTITDNGAITLIGVNHGGDAVTQQAKADLTAAYITAAGLAPTGTITAGTLGGLTLVAGVYNDGGFSLDLTGTITLDAQGNPNATWVFQTGSTLITASGSSVVIINGGQACHVFWQVGSSATLGTGTAFQGNVLALTSITANTGATVIGRLLARNGAVTLDTNTIAIAICQQLVNGTPTTPDDGQGGSDAATAAELARALIAAAQLVDIVSASGLTSIYTQSFAQFDTEVFSLQQRFADIRNARAGVSGAPDVYNPAPIPSEDISWGKNPRGGKGVQGGKTVRRGKAAWGEGVQPREVELAPDDRWGFFITGTGDFATVGDADGTSVGTTLGVDYWVSDHFLLGVSIGYSRSESDLFDGSKVEADGGKVALYGMYQHGGFYAEGLIGGGYSSYDTTRSAFLGDARGSTNGLQFDGYLGVGYDFRMGNWTVTPMISLLYTRVEIDGYREIGSLVPLDIESQHASSLRVRLGPRVAYATQWGDATVTPSFSAQWQHEFLDDRLPIRARFSNDPGSLFTAYGPEIGRDSILLTAALNIAWSRYAAYLAYQADLGRENYENHIALVGFRVSW